MIGKQTTSNGPDGTTTGAGSSLGARPSAATQQAIDRQQVAMLEDAVAMQHTPPARPLDGVELGLGGVDARLQDGDVAPALRDARRHGSDRLDVPDDTRKRPPRLLALFEP